MPKVLNLLSQIPNVLHFMGLSDYHVILKGVRTDHTVDCVGDVCQVNCTVICPTDACQVDCTAIS
jgi:hypothetical protein